MGIYFIVIYDAEKRCIGEAKCAHIKEKIKREYEETAQQSAQGPSSSFEKLNRYHAPATHVKKRSYTRLGRIV
jgi:hypothetical protein